MPVLIHLVSHLSLVCLFKFGPDLRTLIFKLVHDLLVFDRVLLPEPVHLLLLPLNVVLEGAMVDLLRLQLEVQVLQVLVRLRQPLLVGQVVNACLLQLCLQSAYLVIEVLLLVTLT